MRRGPMNVSASNIGNDGGYAGRFKNLVRVGTGSMGTVYRAEDRRTGCTVALKVLRGVELRDRFAREARVLANMDHAHIVRYLGHGAGRCGGPWLAMEWLEGEDLETRLERGPLSVRDTIVLAERLAQALSWAHERGFIHRDIKPSNLFLPDGKVSRVKVLDFGLARLVGDAGTITATGTLMGTLEYMPPEQALDAKRADARADIYSFGAVLFHCLTGRAAATGRNTSEVLARILSMEPPSRSMFPPGTPAQLVHLIIQMLAKDKGDRPKDGLAVLAALARIPLDPTWDSLSTFPVATNWNELTALRLLLTPKARPDPLATTAPTDGFSIPQPPAATSPKSLPEVTLRMPSAPAWPGPPVLNDPAAAPRAPEKALKRKPFAYSHHVSLFLLFVECAVIAAALARLAY
jgi:serine/threonine protein kinase